MEKSTTHQGSLAALSDSDFYFRNIDLTNKRVVVDSTRNPRTIVLDFSGIKSSIQNVVINTGQGGRERVRKVADYQYQLNIRSQVKNNRLQLMTVSVKDPSLPATDYPIYIKDKAYVSEASEKLKLNEYVEIVVEPDGGDGSDGVA